MGNPVKAWEIPGKHGQSREGMGIPEKAWEFPGKHWKSRESMGNPGKAKDIPGEHGKYQEFLGNAVKTREIPGIFSRDRFFKELHSRFFVQCSALQCSAVLLLVYMQCTALHQQ